MKQPTKHVLRPTRETYERFKAELTDIRPGAEGPSRDGDESFLAVHSVYGSVIVGSMTGEAARPGWPFYSIIIATDDVALAARARHELDVSGKP